VHAAWTLPTAPATVGRMRRRATAFAASAGAPPEVAQAVALAVSETVTNAVLHAYTGQEPGQVTVRCAEDGDGRILVEVLDDGRGVETRTDSPGVGHGLAAVGAVVQELDVASRGDGPGTIVTMAFASAAAAPALPGLEPLCDLALERVADVSCLDVVSGGVLRRIAAAVDSDAALTLWLRGAVPPSKPGTATWAALRDGGARLVVHDPSVPRSPGGTGEQLGLAWWVSVPLPGTDGDPAAIWGLGGREGRRPVPTDAVLAALGDAAAADLRTEAGRAALRSRLAA
jgi:serine/threonine-protein kinase RsbW